MDWNDSMELNHGLEWDGIGVGMEMELEWDWASIEWDRDRTGIKVG